MPLDALDPLSAELGPPWRLFTWQGAKLTGNLYVIDGEPITFRVWLGNNDSTEACGYCPPEPYETGEVLLGTVTVRVEESGTHRVELNAAACDSALTWCSQCCSGCDTQCDSL